MAFHKINVTINGGREQVVVPSNMTLLQMLRQSLALTGTKNGCSAGECGACTVMLNGEPVNSCMVLAVECDGAQIVTVEGLAGDKQLDPIQEAARLATEACSPIDDVRGSARYRKQMVRNLSVKALTEVWKKLG